MSGESSNPTLPDDASQTVQPRHALTGEEQAAWIYARLDATSRSFAAVIAALPNDCDTEKLGNFGVKLLPDLRDAVAVFYLVLRALDTVEDDPHFATEKKLPLLRNFSKIMGEKDFDWPGLAKQCGNGHEKILIRSFHVILERMERFPQAYNRTILDITKRMGNGMADFLEREVLTMADYDLYCHYVAGLVGIGLSNLFADCGLEDPRYRELDDVSNSMGLCLQKTNIIRDYLEDINDKRIFWPREIWSKYADRLEDFKDEAYAKEAVWCLNELVTNAVSHLKDAMAYMAGLRDPAIFNFCAIPQIMAVATLALIYNNHDVFTTVVKMPREQTMQIILSMDGVDSLHFWYAKFIDDIAAKVPTDDPNRAAMLQNIATLRRAIPGRGEVTAPQGPSSDASKL